MFENRFGKNPKREGLPAAVSGFISLGMALATASQRPFRSGWLLQRRRKDHFAWDGPRDGVAKTISLGMALATALQRPFQAARLHILAKSV